MARLKIRDKVKKRKRIGVKDKSGKKRRKVGVRRRKKK